MAFVKHSKALQYCGNTNTVYRPAVGSECAILLHLPANSAIVSDYIYFKTGQSLDKQSLVQKDYN